ncbi:HPt (histidine-containing phosphotransfer) domain-containing protein [Mesoflavibacter sabulilitoris]|uniref:Hpt domain-containing protein n=1 Tax=Mesoflavibacter zeaxanthinifaciens subsp. sabulilitoris TaxID=1520893 RepID=A0A2T1NAZ3_9FLAO|nr:Hpt domain-containing protein [Mesoflavibacter zeaxanthinifaciens]MBB3123596.1 HPt (histidine-containing phosphotransfer) domain-containing protein [Mesoflavibacter zeaxanthinifaciens subsp. sabulilitoris]PSG89275.1 Hpt domain-containing protein [Mesoflavibacter zeaxanthinifaciens subsp. sabulilitoris]
MEQHYKLERIKELADNDQDFIMALAQTFLEEVPEDAAVLKTAVENKNYKLSYQTAHKMKPTVDMFELGVLNDLIEVQDWGKFEQTDKDISSKLTVVLTAIDNAVKEIKEDFNL